MNARTRARRRERERVRLIMEGDPTVPDHYGHVIPGLFGPDFELLARNLMVQAALAPFRASIPRRSTGRPGVNWRDITRVNGNA